MNARAFSHITTTLLAVIPAVSALAAGPTKIRQPAAFPIVISKPGSYILTSNLVVPNANTTAIRVTADNVAIDLGGFSILGPAVCSTPPPDNPLTCAPSGTGKGIESSPNVGLNLTVTNGTIKGMGSAGISAAQAQLRNLTVVSNAGDGINVFANSVVTGCTVSGNGFVGIDANGGQRFVNGISMGATSTITGNTVTNNGTIGIGNESGLVAGNTVAGNFIGIDASFGGNVIGNTVTNNSNFGLVAGCSGFIAGYKDNVFFNNNGDNMNPQIQPGCSLNLGNNACGAALCQ